jgi:hypothetical protein
VGLRDALKELATFLLQLNFLSVSSLFCWLKSNIPLFEPSFPF